MKCSIVLMSVIAVALAAPAHAIKITNLDSVAHRVEIAGNGGVEVVSIAPDETVNLPGRPGGLLSLLSAPVAKKGKGVVQSDGLLSGIIGNGRNHGIPAEDRHSYVIWPGARLMLQSRQKFNGGL
jgi:hypothetical protein